MYTMKRIVKYKEENPGQEDLSLIFGSLLEERAKNTAVSLATLHKVVQKVAQISPRCLDIVNRKLKHARF